MKIKKARIFEQSGMIQIIYFDNKERWSRISDGIDTYDDLYIKDNETTKEFLKRLKDFAWNKYLKPIKNRFGKIHKR